MFSSEENHPLPSVSGAVSSCELEGEAAAGVGAHPCAMPQMGLDWTGLDGGGGMMFDPIFSTACSRLVSAEPRLWNSATVDAHAQSR